MHDEEAPTALSAAAWFANPKSAGSAHVCVDDKECYRTLPDMMIPWAAPGANTQGLHIEQAGWASWSRMMWLKHLLTLHRAAMIAARWSIHYDIPLRFLHAPELKAGEKGVTTHAECTKAFGGTHTDPGPEWPQGRFMRMARRRKRVLKLRRQK